MNAFFLLIKESLKGFKGDRDMLPQLFEKIRFLWGLKYVSSKAYIGTADSIVPQDFQYDLPGF